MSFWHNWFWRVKPDHCWHEEDKDGTLGGDGTHYTKRRECCECSREEVWTWKKWNVGPHGKYGKELLEQRWVGVSMGSWY